MISYFRSGPGERRRFRSDTRYATHTSDYGPGKMIFLRTPGAVVRYLHPTHLLPRHTSFIMTVIIDYAPTSNPLRPPPPLLLFSTAIHCPLLRFRSRRRRRHSRPDPRSFIRPSRTSSCFERESRTTYYIATRGYTK